MRQAVLLVLLLTTQPLPIFQDCAHLLESRRLSGLL